MSQTPALRRAVQQTPFVAGKTRTPQGTLETRAVRNRGQISTQLYRSDCSVFPPLSSCHIVNIEVGEQFSTRRSHSDTQSAITANYNLFETIQLNCLVVGGRVAIITARVLQSCLPHNSSLPSFIGESWPVLGSESPDAIICMLECQQP